MSVSWRLCLSVISKSPNSLAFAVAFAGVHATSSTRDWSWGARLLFVQCTLTRITFSRYLILARSQKIYPLLHATQVIKNQGFSRVMHDPTDPRVRGLGEEGFKISRVESGRIKRCSQCHGSGQEIFQNSRVGSGQADPKPIRPARNDS